MSLSNKTEELLSGYLDNQLNGDELREVEAALGDPQVRLRLEELRALRDDLRALSQRTKSSLPPDFARSVWAQIAARGVQPSIAQPSIAQPSSVQASSASVLVAADAGATTNTLKWLSAVAGLAAMLFLAIYIGKGFSTSKPGDDLVAADDLRGAGDLADNGQQDKAPLQDKLPDFPIAPEETSSDDVAKQLVGRTDLRIYHLMTADVELEKGKTTTEVLGPLLEKYAIELVKGAKVNKEIGKALNDIRMTAVEDDNQLASEVFLIRADLMALDAILEDMRGDGVQFPVVRLGLAMELPTEPLLDKLSLNLSESKEQDELLGAMKKANHPIALGQAIANSLVSEVDQQASFAAPLVDPNKVEFGVAQIESIPPQGKLTGSSSKRQSQSLLSAGSEVGGAHGKGFLLLFVRVR